MMVFREVAGDLRLIFLVKYVNTLLSPSAAVDGTNVVPLPKLVTVELSDVPLYFLPDALSILLILLVIPKKPTDAVSITGDRFVEFVCN